MSDSSVPALVNAKEEYSRQLINIFRSPLYQGIKSIYSDAKDIASNENRPNDTLMIFQDLLSRIPKWSQDIINKEYSRIIDVTQCDWIDDLLKVVYVSHIKVLTIVHNSQKNKKISLSVPSGSYFMHLCYIEIAREFWKNPYLFSDRATKLEQQKNIRDSETIIGECVIETIRKQLPVRHILKEYFADEEDDEIQETDVQDQSVTAPENPNLSKKYLKKLETVVKKELKNDGDYNISMEDTIRRIIKEELTRTNTPINEAKVDKNLIDSVVEKVKEEKSATPTPTVSTPPNKEEENIENGNNSGNNSGTNTDNNNTNTNDNTSNDTSNNINNVNDSAKEKTDIQVAGGVETQTPTPTQTTTPTIDNNTNNTNNNTNNTNPNSASIKEVTVVSSSENSENSSGKNNDDNNDKPVKKTNDIVIENIDDIDLELTVDDDNFNGDKNKSADRETKSPNPLDSLNLDGLEEFDISGTNNNDNSGGFSFFKDAKDN